MSIEQQSSFRQLYLSNNVQIINLLFIREL